MAALSGNEIGDDLQLDVGIDVLPPSRLLTDATEILAARRLHAMEHVRMGYVDPSALTAEGVLTTAADPWVAHSRYFGAFDPGGRLRATVRVISNTAPLLLPTLRLGTIHPEVRRELEELPPGRLGEVASLARDGGVTASYPRGAFRAMWRDAMTRDETTWILNVDAPVLRTLRTMDTEVFHVVGAAAPAPVRPVFPVRVQVAEMHEQMFERGITVDVVVLP